MTHLLFNKLAHNILDQPTYLDQVVDLCSFPYLFLFLCYPNKIPAARCM